MRISPAEGPWPTATSDRYRLLVETVTEYAIYMLDPEGIILTWNSSAQRLTGYSESEITGAPFEKLFGVEDRTAGAPARVLRAAGEDKYQIEQWIFRNNGERIWAHVVIDPIHGTDGSVLGYAVTTRDLTERKLADECLRSSEEQFRLLVQGVTDYAIYMLDREGKVSSWNAGAERIKGYSPDEIIGQHFSLFIPWQIERRECPRER